MATSFINIKALAKRIAEVEKELANLLHLQSFIGGGTKKRGRPAGRKTVGDKIGNGKPAVKRGHKTKERGAVSEGILKYLSMKKDGAHVKDIAAHVGSKPVNVTAFAYSAKGKATLKKVKPGTFALKG